MTIVVGAGQAGLAVSHELTAAGLDHTVLERGEVANTWRRRWDTFCLVTPNWTVQLPGGSYDGADPDAYMPRDEVVAHLERYARSFSAPVREGVEVRSLMLASDGFILATSEGELRARTVVLTTGAYQKPHRPKGAEGFSGHVQIIDAEQYRNPDELARGSVLIVGSGQTGCQLAEELHEAGREVFLACGRAPWVPRRVGGRDIAYWIKETGFFDQQRTALPTPAARLIANQQATGHGGGHDLHYRTLRAKGVTLLGRLQSVGGGQARFASDLGESVAFGDARYAQLRQMIQETCARKGFIPPDMPDPEPFDGSAPDSLPVDRLGAVIFTSGFRPDYASWVHIPGAFDESGFPVEQDGASLAAPGLYFCGVHFMRKRKSSLLIGVGEDAAIVARAVVARAQSSGRTTRPAGTFG
ncbi:MAG TPA: NAD(P)-binding domain-containing protein [Candidatus Polarisedimenticolia bacterium]|nr:NAD(P)-binding domain-containing protein [Candidatus Polarisedimenticolia bacterium]